MSRYLQRGFNFRKKPSRGLYRWLSKSVPLLVGVTKAVIALMSSPVDERQAVFGNPKPEDENRLTAVLVFDRGFFQNLSGSRRVLEAQIAALRHFGFRVCALVVHPASYAGRVPVTEEEVFALDLDIVFETAPRCTFNTFLKCAWFMRPNPIGGQRSMRELQIMSNLAPVPRGLKDFLQARQPDVTLVNYVWNVPLAKRVADGAPMIVETHDIQSRQIAYWRGEESYELNLQTELEMLDGADALIALNADEAHFFTDQFGPDRSALIYPPSKSSTWTNPSLTTDQAITESGPALHVDAVGDEAPTLLFVGSRHRPNRIGVDWMVDQVLPLVASHCPKAVMLVAGAVADTMPPDRLFELRQRPDLRILGRVDDLSPIYHAVQLVVVPIHDGTGVSIKTIEAMAFGKPIVTTSVGLRGFPKELVFPYEDTPGGFAARISTLLTNEEERLIAAQQSQKLFEAHFSVEAYHHAIGRLLESIGVAIEGGPKGGIKQKGLKQ